MPKISVKGSAMPQSPIRKLVPYAQSAKIKGVNVLHLNIGQPDIKTPKTAIDAVKNLSLDTLAYSRTEGSDEHRSKVAAYYNSFGAKITAEDLIITTGGSEALSFVMASLLDTEDEIIIPEPFYANYNGFAAANNLVVKSVTATIDNNFALPKREAFELHINHRTKAILICNPSNPTGYVYKLEELKFLAGLCKKHDLFLIVDEVYREFVYGENEFYSALLLEGMNEHVVVIDSISKRYSMCGARIGYVVTKNNQVRSCIIKFAQARLSPPTIAQIAGEAALDTPESYLKEVNIEYNKRRLALKEGLSAIEGVRVSDPQGAFYLIAELPVADAEHFSRWLLEHFEYDGETVMLAPAAGFYATKGLGINQVRIAYVLETEALKRAIRLLDIALTTYKKRTH